MTAFDAHHHRPPPPERAVAGDPRRPRSPRWPRGTCASRCCRTRSRSSPASPTVIAIGASHGAAPPARDAARGRRRHRPRGRGRDHPLHRDRRAAAGDHGRAGDVGRGAAQRLRARDLRGRGLGDAARDHRAVRRRARSRRTGSSRPRSAARSRWPIALLFSPDPNLPVSRAAQAVFGRLGRALEGTASALDDGDAAHAEQALEQARSIEGLLRELDAELATSRETVRTAPTRFGDREPIDRYDRTLEQIDLAVRNTRVLARHSLRAIRAGETPVELRDAVSDLAGSVWALAAAYDEPRARRRGARAGLRRRRRGDRAGRWAPGSPYAEVAAPVRSTAVDLMRAAELVAGAPEELADRGAAAAAGTDRGDGLGADARVASGSMSQVRELDASETRRAAAALLELRPHRRVGRGDDGARSTRSARRDTASSAAFDERRRGRGRGGRVPRGREPRVGALPLRRRPRHAGGGARARARRRGDGVGLRDRGAEGCGELHLDSGVGADRQDAHRFYFRHGMRITSYHFAAGAGVIGVARRRRDGEAKVRGPDPLRGRHAGPGLLHARPVLAAEAHARLLVDRRQRGAGGARRRGGADRRRPAAHGRVGPRRRAAGARGDRLVRASRSRW